MTPNALPLDLGSPSSPDTPSAGYSSSSTTSEEESPNDILPEADNNYSIVVSNHSGTSSYFDRYLESLNNFDQINDRSATRMESTNGTNGIASPLDFNCRKLLTYILGSDFYLADLPDPELGTDEGSRILRHLEETEGVVFPNASFARRERRLRRGRWSAFGVTWGTVRSAVEEPVKNAKHVGPARGQCASSLDDYSRIIWLAHEESYVQKPTATRIFAIRDSGAIGILCIRNYLFQKGSFTTIAGYLKRLFCLRQGINRSPRPL
ncbi:hypothetical protein CPB86DRAFT_799776 [Serendipita vermifera]|nr:hypothetical protein CPB86DRAFT_799776 [Serendipita vermifera]